VRVVRELSGKRDGRWRRSGGKFEGVGGREYGGRGRLRITYVMRGRLIFEK
jgi:hypothetical protein